MLRSVTYAFVDPAHMAFGSSSSSHAQHPTWAVSLGETEKYKISGNFWTPVFGTWTPFSTLCPGTNYSLYPPLMGPDLRVHLAGPTPELAVLIVTSNETHGGTIGRLERGFSQDPQQAVASNGFKQFSSTILTFGI